MPNKAVIKALLGAFPTAASFYDFKSNDREIARQAIAGILKFAYSNNVIARPSEAAFIAFLEKNKQADDQRMLPDGLTFHDVLDKLAGHMSVNSLIAQLEVTAKVLSLPDIQASMITRLKQRFIINTPKKRVLLRIMAFRLAQKYPDLNWHYELLKQLPVIADGQTDPIHETGGVIITFHLKGRGAIITHQDASWLKYELSDCIEYLRLENHVIKKSIETIGATTLNFKIPKKAGPLKEPRLYTDIIRKVMAIAHQMATRWLLSDASSFQKKLIIIIHAGLISEAGEMVQRILEMPLDAESGVYLTDFARLCSLYASVKAAFEPCAKWPHPLMAEGGSLWAVSCFLSYGYYDYIPCLLDEKMLPQSLAQASFEDFRQTLLFPEQAGDASYGAIKAMQRFPQSALLLMEIAKVLYTRNMWFEADTVLANLLLSDRSNWIARLMRMLIYTDIACLQPDLPSAILSFERADAEGEYLIENFRTEFDIWHEVGILNFRQSIKYLDYLNEEKPSCSSKIQRTDVISHLHRAKSAFLKGMAASPTGKAQNSLYMFAYTLCLLELFREAWTSHDEDQPRTDVAEIFKSVSSQIFRNIGWLREDIPDQENKVKQLSRTLSLLIARYENLVLCRSNSPYIKYQFGMLTWDFAPQINLQIFRMTMEWLRIAIKEAEPLIADNISVYDLVCGQISAGQFMDHVRATMDVLCQHVKEEDFHQETHNPQMIKKLKELSSIKLMFRALNRMQSIL